MSDSTQDKNERGYLLPPGCKDLLDAIKHEEAPKPETVSYPPITRKVILPNVVAVRFLAEVSGQEPETITALMNKLYILVDVNRSVDFAAAQKLLRHFGIGAERSDLCLTR